MANKQFEVREYQLEYPSLNLRKYNENKERFDYGMLICYTKECERGFKVKKVGKTTAKGTMFTYERIKDNEDCEQYNKFLMEMVNNFNKKYDEKLKAVSSVIK